MKLRLSAFLLSSFNLERDLRSGQFPPVLCDLQPQGTKLSAGASEAKISNVWCSRFLGRPGEGCQDIMGEITRETRLTRKISKGFNECVATTRLKAVHTGLRMWLTRPRSVCLACRSPWVLPPTSHNLGEMARNSGSK